MREEVISSGGTVDRTPAARYTSLSCTLTLMLAPDWSRIRGFFSPFIQSYGFIQLGFGIYLVFREFLEIKLELDCGMD